MRIEGFEKIIQIIKIFPADMQMLAYLGVLFCLHVPEMLIHKAGEEGKLLIVKACSLRLENQRLAEIGTGYSCGVEAVNQGQGLVPAGHLPLIQHCIQRL